MDPFNIPLGLSSAVSSTKGRISRILFVDIVDFVDDELRVLNRVTPYFDQFAKSETIYFDVLVQFDTDLPHHGLLATKSDAAFFERLSGAYKAVLEKHEFSENNDWFEKQRNGAKTSVRILLPNIDGTRILNQFRKVFNLPSTNGPADIYQLYKFVQDPFLVTYSSSSCFTILQPYYYWPIYCPAGNCSDDFEKAVFSQYLSPILSSISNIAIRYTPFYFQGGNIIVGDDFAFLGRDVLMQNLEEFGGLLGNEPIRRFIELFRNTLGVKFIFFPDWDSQGDELPSKQLEELYHLDMFITLAGEVRENQFLVFVGEVREWNDIDNEWEIVAQSDPVQSELSKVESNLKVANFNNKRFLVKRLPIIRIRLGTGIKYYYYNNCLVEITGSGLRRVISMTLKEIIKGVKAEKADSLVIDAWNEFSFEVNFVNIGADSLILNKAGLHCILHVIERSYD